MTTIQPTMSSATIAPRVILAFSLKVVGLSMFVSNADRGGEAIPDEYIHR